MTSFKYFLRRLLLLFVIFFTVFHSAKVISVEFPSKKETVEADRPDKPVDLQKQKKIDLTLDDSSANGLYRKASQNIQRRNMLIKRTVEPVILSDKEWEKGATLFVIAVFPDEKSGKIRMYYIARFENSLKNVVCMAESEDGYSWIKPDLGEGTNIIMKGSGNKLSWGEFIPFTILFDKQEADPAYSYKMVYWDRPDSSLYPGICLAVSSDGIKWNSLSNSPIIINANDAMTLIENNAEDNQLKKKYPYFIYQQTWKYNPKLPVDRDNLKEMHRIISIWYSQSSFVKRWVGPITVLEPDEKDPFDLQFYLLTTFHAVDCYGGLLMAYHTTDQTMDIQLVSSTNGWIWKRENNREPLIPLGKRGQFDCGMVYTTAKPFLWRGKVLIFYTGLPSVHDGKLRYPGDPNIPGIGNIGLAEFKEDFFMFPNRSEIK